ncbi:hypothetical protein CB0940_10845 [Cercospora beticola]|uniref:Peptidase S54 rhomboid domain-containing protein n=1 Tax=Cercospora beticola TaxID=122368 RepID=A0A2G5HTS4_CERBT|nr:hypothetical protein CB0940_10845 [Cercospora beticola]PIA95944.1 hypothetical protein CB0940_10845 [Cercospora beticola]WPB07577.1 hypothetical protein RHO25_012238 [Cercospora beticola]
MDVFVPWQYDVARDPYGTISTALGSIFPTILKTKTEDVPADDSSPATSDHDLPPPHNGELNKSALAAVGVIAALNLPAYRYYRSQHTLAVLEAQNGLPGKCARWVSYISSTLSRNILDACVRYKWSQKTIAMTENTMLSYDSIRSGRWWTLLSSNFVHQEAAHFKVNVYCLLWYGTSCARVPGVSWKEVFGLAIVTGLASSIATLLRLKWQGSWIEKEFQVSRGLSGVVYGFAAVAALNAYRNKERMPSGFSSRIRWIISQSIYACDRTFPMTIIARDIAALFGRPYNANEKGINHAGHVAGAVSGVAFYFFVLYKRKRSQASCIAPDSHPGDLSKEHENKS